jgi:hypothetical protein
MKCCLELVGHAPFGPFDVRLLRELLPHLGRALRQYVTIMRAESRTSVYQEAIEHFALFEEHLRGDGHQTPDRSDPAHLQERGVARLSIASAVSFQPHVAPKGLQMTMRMLVIGSLTAMMLPLAGGAESVKRVEDDGTVHVPARTMISY